MDEDHIFNKDWASRFEWTEYLVFGALLVVSMGIGVFFGCFKKSKNETSEDFLMAGRSMPILPVALSVLCSFVSAVTLLGNPAEVYFYGLQYIIEMLSFLVMNFALAYLYIPVYFNLGLTSVYEYFEMRFNPNVRFAISISQIPHMLIYMPLAVYGPCLALKQVAGIDERWTSAVVFIVCIAYSSIGGLKAVLWTDAFQAMVMLSSMISVVAVGISNVGGIDVVWQRAERFDRTKIFNLDMDPRTRHTFWTGLIGGYFNWMPLFGATQTLIQRYLSVPSLSKAKSVVWITTGGLCLLTTLCSLTGIVIFANYIDCDPTKDASNIIPAMIEFAISSSDQLVPLFVMDILGDIPVLPGLFVAGLTAGSLSTVSSVLNSLTAVIIEDHVKKYRKDLSEEKLGYISKFVSAGAGAVAFVLVFVIAEVGSILPFASLLHGTFVGPILGFFTLGMFFPWANWMGTLLGSVPAVAFTLFIGIGSILAGNNDELPNQKLPLFYHGCNATHEDFTGSPFAEQPAFSDSFFSFDPKAATAWKNNEDSLLIKLLSISYMWHAMIPVVTTIIFGLLFSFIIMTFKTFPKSEEKYFSAPILTMWKKIFGKKHLSKWVNFEEDSKPTLEKLETLEKYQTGVLESKNLIVNTKM